MINQLPRTLLISTPSDYQDNEFEDDFDDDVEDSENGN